MMIENRANFLLFAFDSVLFLLSLYANMLLLSEISSLENLA